MIGFEITMNGQVLNCGLEDGNTHIIATVYQENISNISVLGFDMIRHMSWKRERLIEGDEIIIKVVDLEKKDCSTPASYDLVDTEAIRYSMDWLLKTLTENGYTL